MNPFAIAVLLHAVAASAAPAQAASPIQAARIREDVRILSSDEFQGRGPGQAGERKTLDHLVRQFTAAGLQPGLPGGLWLQEVPLTVFERQAASLTLRTARSGDQPLVIGRDVTATAQAPGRSRLTRAPLVFVGYGVKAPEFGWDSFAGADLRGKVAVVLANDPDFEAEPGSPAAGRFGGRTMVFPGRFGAKVAAAKAAGAAAVLVIHEDAAASYPWRQVANGDRIPSMALAQQPASPPPALAFTGWLHRDAAVRLLRGAGLDLQQLKSAARSPDFRPVAIEGVSLSADITVRTRPIVSHNVIARLPGRTRPNETVIYGAHWDANGKGAPDARGDDIRNGAVDNALGTAELIEVARAFTAGRRPERSIVFIAFTAEEKGLLGAEHYAANPAYPHEQVAAMINLDPHVMLGRARNVELVGGGRTDLDDSLTRAAALQRLRVDPEPNPEAGWYFRSDHFAFSKRGVPSLAFRIGRDLVEGGVRAGAPRVQDYNVNRYHQPDDEFDPNWSFAGAAQEGTLAWRIGAEIANSRRWPSWRPGVEYARLRGQSDAARR